APIRRSPSTRAATSSTATSSSTSQRKRNQRHCDGCGAVVRRRADLSAVHRLFLFEGGSNHFNDKPMIAADMNAASPFKDSIYVAWDAATGGSTGGAVRFARSTDHGVTFTITRIDDPRGPGRAIGALPFVGPNGEVYAAWNDYGANTIAFNRSTDGG